MYPFRTVEGVSSAEYTEKGSRFISFLAHVESEDEAIAFRKSIKERIPQASHYVSAYIINTNNIMHYSDAKEPHGTAGMPVFTVIDKLGLRDVVCVVARIFGGTLLGRGGLMRAYTRAAQMACEAATIVQKAPCSQVLAAVPYSMYESVLKLVESFEGAKLQDTIFADDITLDMLIKSEFVNTLCKDIEDLCNGNADIVVGSETIASISWQ